MSDLLGDLGAGASIAGIGSTVAQAGTLAAAGNAATLAMAQIQLQQQMTGALAGIMATVGTNLKSASGH